MLFDHEKLLNLKFLLGFLAGFFVAFFVMFGWAVFTFPTTFMRCDVADGPVEKHLDHFYVLGRRIPNESSRHYYFRCGFRKPDEFWSFDLPPEKMELFVSDYVMKAHISCRTTGDNLPYPVTYSLADDFKESYDKWRPGLWFDSLENLDEIYCGENENRGDFVAYSKEKGRVYLMKWSF